MTGAQAGTVLHASSVALDGRAALILGPSGSGKSGLALELIALGCALVSDDRTQVRARDGALIASAPEAIRGRIEARGIGILASGFVAAAPVALAIDLAAEETARLPPDRTFTAEGCTVPLVLGRSAPHLPAAIMLLLRGGRIA